MFLPELSTPRTSRQTQTQCMEETSRIRPQIRLHTKMFRALKCRIVRSGSICSHTTREIESLGNAKSGDIFPLRLRNITVSRKAGLSALECNVKIPILAPRAVRLLRSASPIFINTSA
jgi:hypothetical protein